MWMFLDTDTDTKGIKFPMSPQWHKIWLRHFSLTLEVPSDIKYDKDDANEF